MRLEFTALLAAGLLLGACRSAGNNRNQETTAVADTTRTATVNREITLKKEFLYDRYTLNDTYPYKDTVREFQWEKIKQGLKTLESHQGEPARWGVVKNRRNVNGLPELVDDYERDDRNHIVDEWGTERSQGIPLYLSANDEDPERYAMDGALVKVLQADSGFYRVETVYFEGQWYIPDEYVTVIDTVMVFTKVVVVDRTNQNIAALEKSGDQWLIRSMNPATTGADNPPYAQDTPLGLFVVQEKKPKMYYYRDGTTTIAGYAPYASRFCEGAYVHGVPVNSPNGAMIEYSQTLGTVPRSHMCVRNATSHAKFIYDWAPIERALVYVIE